MDRLNELIADGVIDEIYNQLKSGKEAEVWLVSHRGEPVAAKIYKAREFRNFKNDAGYKEGRTVRNTRTQRAMDKGSKFGREASEEAWKSAEADAMFALHAAGVRVPKPVLYYEGVLLMEVIGDAEGRVAPRLVDAGLTREQAGAMFLTLRGEIIKMLAADLIHGDLSEFNVLLGINGPVIIDFPQVVTAAKNSRSEQYFRRDLGNMLRFFSSFDPSLAKHASDADEIWRAYVRRDLSPHFVPSGRLSRPPQQGHHPRGGPPQQHRGQRPAGQLEQNQRPGSQRPAGPGRPAQAPNQAPRPTQNAPRPQGAQEGGARKGPEVSFKGAAPQRSGQPQRQGRRRPPRRF
jgi:RIO kinase 1